MNSCQKGKRGEREAAAFLRSHGFAAAKRGQQFHGGADSPDVAGVPGWHLEIKRVERLNLRDAVAQAAGDAGGQRWAVLHRWNNGQWLAIVRAEDFLDLIRASLDPQPATQPAAVPESAGPPSTNLGQTPTASREAPAHSPQPREKGTNDE